MYTQESSLVSAPLYNENIASQTKDCCMPPINFTKKHQSIDWCFLSGERGIWTLAPVARPTPLAGAPLRPLEYFSELVLHYDFHTALHSARPIINGTHFIVNGFLKISLPYYKTEVTVSIHPYYKTTFSLKLFPYKVRKRRALCKPSSKTSSSLNPTFW